LRIICFMKSPNADEIKTTRLAYGLTQAKASELIGKKIRIWQMYEKGEQLMNGVLWELFLTKVKKLEVKNTEHGGR
jgi:hypothetical protein